MEAGSASVKALVTVVALGAAAHAAVPYLPLVGPPPLRIEVIKNPVAPVVVKFEGTNTPPPAVTNIAAAVETNVSQTVASLVPTNAGPAMATSPVPSPEPSPERSLGDAFSASVFALPTPDLLGITPQTLATYFRPVQFGTNSTPVLVQLPLSFTPPFPPDKSSHAEYILK